MNDSTHSKQMFRKRKKNNHRKKQSMVIQSTHFLKEKAKTNSSFQYSTNSNPSFMSQFRKSLQPDMIYSKKSEFFKSNKRPFEKIRERAKQNMNRQGHLKPDEDRLNNNYRKNLKKQLVKSRMLEGHFNKRNNEAIGKQRRSKRNKSKVMKKEKINKKNSYNHFKRRSGLEGIMNVRNEKRSRSLMKKREFGYLTEKHNYMTVQRDTPKKNHNSPVKIKLANILPQSSRNIRTNLKGNLLRMSLKLSETQKLKGLDYSKVKKRMRSVTPSTKTNRLQKRHLMKTGKLKDLKKKDREYIKTRESQKSFKQWNNQFVNPEEDLKLMKQKESSKLFKSIKSLNQQKFKSSIKRDIYPKLKSRNSMYWSDLQPVEIEEPLDHIHNSEGPLQTSINNNDISKPDYPTMEFKFANVSGLQNGKEKVGQDSVLVYNFTIESVNYSLFGIFDGHGSHGHHVSSFLRKNLASILKKLISLYGAEKFEFILEETVKLLEQKIWSITKKFKEKYHVRGSISGSTERANSNLFDGSLSGSTCSLIIIFENNMYCLTVGDSKCVIGVKDETSQTNLKGFQISTEHKTENKSEVERVLREGGIVQAVLDQNNLPVGPLRVWDSSLNYPGLMVTRTFGDFVGKNCGISSVPGTLK